MGLPKDVEIVYDLQWKHGSGHGEDKANIVGMYDIPATTLNWDTFKSYLLKNCGATGDDVKVSYVSIDDKEFPIESQLDFQIALYSFRQRARNGDIITLRLERVANQGGAGRTKRSGYPSGLKEAKPQVASEIKMPAAIALERSSDGPPGWFKEYMAEFKREIVEEVTAAVVGSLPSVKVAAPVQVPCHYPRKLKVECSKRPRKISFNKDDKMQRKLDCKIEKLEQKTLKIKEKKLALMRGNDGQKQFGSNLWPCGILPNNYNGDRSMDASSVDHHELVTVSIPGGEIYHHEWDIVNSGENDWTEDTELQYAWGSEALRPVERCVKCPLLRTGEKGKIAVNLVVSEKPGQYECYWHFYHKGRRFGQWLGCQVNVESSLPNPTPLFLDNNEKELSKALNAISCWSSSGSKKLSTDDVNCDENTNLFCSASESEYMSDLPYNLANKCFKSIDVQNVDLELRQMKICDDLATPNSECSLECDIQSIISIADSNSTRSPTNDFVMVPTDSSEIPAKAMEDSTNLLIPDSDEGKLEKTDLPVESTGMKRTAAFIEGGEVNDSKVTENRHHDGFAYITVEGKKIAVPKCLLRSDYLATAEEAPGPNDTLNVSVGSLESLTVKVDIEDVPEDSEIQLKFDNPTSPHTSVFSTPSSNDKQIDAPSDPSNAEFHTKSVDNMNKSRLFVFPSNCPGFEVVYPSGGDTTSNGEVSGKPQQGNYTYLPNLVCTSNPYNSAWSSAYSPKNLFGMSYGYTNMPVMATLPQYPVLASVLLPPQNATGTNYYSYHEPQYPPYSNLKGKIQQGPPVNTPMPKSSPVQSEDCNGRPAYYQPQVQQMQAKAPPVYPKSLSSSYSGYPLEKGGGNYNTAQLPSMHAAFSGNQKNVDKQTRTSKKPEAQMLPNALVTGAVNVASSAVNTARSVLNMFSPQPSQQQPQWPHGSWNGGNLLPSQDMALRILADMGFWDRERNMALLARYNGDLSRVVSELVH